MKDLFKRTVAYLVDSSLCYIAIMVMVQWGIISHFQNFFGLTDEWFRDSWNLEGYVLLSISLPVWSYFSYFDSIKSKGTWGKRWLGIRVTDAKNQPIPLTRSIIRTFFKLLPWEIAHLGLIFPTPIYFDVNPEITFLTWFGIGLFMLYVISILVSEENKAIYDRWMGTQIQTIE